MNIETELLEEYSVLEIKQGFYEDSKGYICIVCGERFEKGEIYNFEGKLFEGSKAIHLHIKKAHEPIEQVLLNVSAITITTTTVEPFRKRFK